MGRYAHNLAKSPWIGSNCLRSKLVYWQLNSHFSRRWSSYQTPRSPSITRTIFSGIQPTGVPHLGNYLGALREWVRLQDDATEETSLYFSIVDLHALTVPQENGQLRRWRKEAFATLIAVGLDPSRSTIFYQSSVCDWLTLIDFPYWTAARYRHMRSYSGYCAQ